MIFSVLQLMKVKMYKVSCSVERRGALRCALPSKRLVSSLSLVELYMVLMCTLLGSVPVVVEYGTYWTRYFYRLNKLQQIENARVNLVKRECDLLFIFL